MRRLTLAVLLFIASIPALADELTVRVVDVGAGLCCVVKIPGGDDGDHYIVYDAGNFQYGGKHALNAVTDIIPADEPIDLLVLSHGDADHIAAVPDILSTYVVERVIRTGLRFGTASKTLKKVRKAIAKAVEDDGTLDLNLSETEFPNGATYRFGGAFVTMICGFGALPDSWDVRNQSEKNNAPSIVLKITYAGKSILLCGDAIGRHSGDTDVNALIATERYMVEQKAVIPIDVDVVVAPHHGGDNGSSTAFIAATSPEWVVFSAGHKYEHPRKSAAKRYTDAGVLVTKMFRTDREDDEGAKEWNHERKPNHRDKAGDDDVEITITKGSGGTGVVTVKYRD